MEWHVERVSEVAGFAMLPFVASIGREEVGGFVSRDPLDWCDKMAIERAWPPAKGRQFSREGLRSFFGPSDLMIYANLRLSRDFRLFVLPTSVLNVVEFAKVGTGNRGNRGHVTEWEVVKEEFGHVFARWPFEISYADDSVMRGWFLNEVSLADAQEIQDVIVRVAPDSVDADEEGVLTAARDIVREQRFALWWERR